jgi:hypothetical protein
MQWAPRLPSYELPLFATLPGLDPFLSPISFSCLDASGNSRTARVNTLRTLSYPVQTSAHTCRRNAVRVVVKDGAPAAVSAAEVHSRPRHCTGELYARVVENSEDTFRGRTSRKQSWRWC